LLGCYSRRGSPRDDNVELEDNKFRDAGGEFLGSLRQSIFDEDVLTFYITKLAETLPECLAISWGKSPRL
jgi:hypothetical protein